MQPSEPHTAERQRRSLSSAERLCVPKTERERYQRKKTSAQSLYLSLLISPSFPLSLCLYLWVLCVSLSPWYRLLPLGFCLPLGFSPVSFRPLSLSLSLSCSYSEI